MARVTIRCLNVSEYDKWDKFVAESPQGTLFHKSYWLRALSKEPSIYGYFKGQEILGGLPLICNVSKLGLKRAFHPYLTPYLGVIFREGKAKYVKQISEEKKISRAIAARIKENFDSIQFRFTPFSADLMPFIWEGFSTEVRYTYLLEINNLENVWKGMDENRRNDIRHAEKNGIHVERSNDFKQMFALVEKTFERQKKKVAFKSAAFKYNEILSRKGQCKSFLAIDKNGVVLASVYIVWDEKRSYYILGGHYAEKHHCGASPIALWEAIKFTKEELKLNEFDFEGSMIQSLELFFRKFGGRLTPCYVVRWVKPSSRAALYAMSLVKAGLSKLKLK